MEYICKTKEFQFAHTVVTIGKFDGIHCGHRLLLEDAGRQKKPDQKTVVFSFDHNPAGVLSGTGQGVVYSEEEKCYLMEQLGVDVLISYPFDWETSRMPADVFIRQVLLKQLGVEKVIIGQDCRFGYQRQGNAAMLSHFAQQYGFEVQIFDKKVQDGEAISSTRIRELLAQGKMELANAMLGAPYMIYAEVVHGRQLGRQLGMPTINQIPAAGKVLPPNGVYASVIEIPKEGRFFGITNLGVKPTVGSAGILAETNIFQYSGDLYGKKCRVFLHHFQRGEKKFASVDVLKLQMQQDMKEAERYLHW